MLRDKNKHIHPVIKDEILSLEWADFVIVYYDYYRTNKPSELGRYLQQLKNNHFTTLKNKKMLFIVNTWFDENEDEQFQRKAIELVIKEYYNETFGSFGVELLSTIVLGTSELRKRNHEETLTKRLKNLQS